MRSGQAHRRHPRWDFTFFIYVIVAWTHASCPPPMKRHVLPVQSISKTGKGEQMVVPHSTTAPPKATERRTSMSLSHHNDLYNLVLVFNSTSYSGLPSHVDDYHLHRRTHYIFKRREADKVDSPWPAFSPSLSSWRCTPSNSSPRFSARGIRITLQLPVWRFSSRITYKHLEIVLIWPTQWNLVKIMYFANRYLPLAFLPVIVFYNVAPGPLSPQTCKTLFSVPCMGIAFCLLISEVILYIRVYALSGKTRCMVIFLILHGATIILTCLVLFAYYLALGRFAPSPYPQLAGCFGVSSGNNRYVVACFALVLYSGLVTMSLCIWCGLKTYWISRHSRLVKIFYRDGTFYFVMLVILSLTNGFVALLAPGRYRFMMAIPQEVMHNVITSRMILHLREHARQSMGFTSIASSGPIDFDMFNSGFTIDVADVGTEPKVDELEGLQRNGINVV